MAAIEQMEFDIAAANPQAPRVAFGDFGRIEFVGAPRDVQERSADTLVRRGFPIGRDAPANSYDAAKLDRTGGREAIIERHGLRESYQQPPAGRNAARSPCIVQNVHHHFMVQTDGGCAVTAGSPPVPGLPVIRRKEELVRSLDGRNCVTWAEHLLR